MGAYPLAVLVLLILVARTPIHWAVSATFVLVLISAGFYFETPTQTLVNATFYGLLKGLWPIVVVIFGAIFSYNLMQKTGSIRVLRALLSGVSDDVRIQILLLSWCFGGFLEGAAGFATAVAIPLSILIALRVDPIRAATATLAADTVSTAFGAVGIPVAVLAANLGLDPGALGGEVLTQLVIVNFLLPFLMVAIIGGGVKALRGMMLPTAAVSAATIIPQYVTARFIGPELAGFAGSLTSLIVLAAYAKLSGRTTPEAYRLAAAKDAGAEASAAHSLTAGVVLRASTIYVLMMLFIVATSPLFPAVHDALGQVETIFAFPLADATVLNARFDWIESPGVLIAAAAVIGGTLQGARASTILSAAIETLGQLRKPAIAIMVIVAMATVMDVSGIINTVAKPLLAAAGNGYPYIAPAIGAVGTFLTGSVVNANVLFGKLQMTAAHTLGMSPLWLAAANAAGATAGKMIAPQTLAIAVSASGLVGADGLLMKRVLKWCLLYLVIVCVISGSAAALAL